MSFQQIELTGIARGSIFEHRHWLDAKNMPLLCRVTAVRRGVVYWRAWTPEGVEGHPYSFALSEAPRFVRQVLQ